jgi:hypothetical protein
MALELLERTSIELPYDVVVDVDGMRQSVQVGAVIEAPIHGLTGSPEDRDTSSDAGRSWIRPFLDRITFLSAVPVLSREGRTLNADDLADAFDFLSRVMHEGVPSPWIGRLNSGGLQLNWNQGAVEVEAVFDRARGDKVVMIAGDEAEQEVPADEADSVFASVAERLVPSSHDRRSPT